MTDSEAGGFAPVVELIVSAVVRRDKKALDALLQSERLDAVCTVMAEMLALSWARESAWTERMVELNRLVDRERQRVVELRDIQGVQAKTITNYKARVRELGGSPA